MVSHGWCRMEQNRGCSGGAERNPEVALRVRHLGPQHREEGPTFHADGRRRTIRHWSAVQRAVIGMQREHREDSQTIPQPLLGCVCSPKLDSRKPGGTGVDATRLATAAGRGARGAEAEARLSRAGPEHTLLGRPEADEAANAGCRQGRRESRSRIKAIGVRRRDRTGMGKNPRVPEARGSACDHHRPWESRRPRRRPDAKPLRPCIF